MSLPDGVDIAAGAQVHDGIGAGLDRRLQLLELFSRIGVLGRRPDIGIDLDREALPDPDGPEPAVSLVGGDDDLSLGYPLLRGFG